MNADEAIGLWKWAVGLGVLGVGYYTRTVASAMKGIAKIADDARSKAEDAQDDVADFREDVAKNYASKPALNAVRLEIRDEIRQGRAEMMDFLRRIDDKLDRRQFNGGANGGPHQ